LQLKAHLIDRHHFDAFIHDKHFSVGANALFLLLPATQHFSDFSPHPYFL